MDFVSRLSRHIVGQHLGWMDPRLDRVADRAVAPEPDPLRARLEKPLDAPVASTGTRAPTRLVDPKPNAPQLIRLVRTPFRLEGVRPARQEIVAPREARADRAPT